MGWNTRLSMRQFPQVHSYKQARDAFRSSTKTRKDLTRAWLRKTSHLNEWMVLNENHGVEFVRYERTGLIWVSDNEIRVFYSRLANMDTFTNWFLPDGIDVKFKGSNTPLIECGGTAYRIPTGGVTLLRDSEGCWTPNEIIPFLDYRVDKEGCQRAWLAAGGPAFEMWFKAVVAMDGVEGEAHCITEEKATDLLSDKSRWMELVREYLNYTKYDPKNLIEGLRKSVYFEAGCVEKIELPSINSNKLGALLARQRKWDYLFP